MKKLLFLVLMGIVSLTMCAQNSSPLYELNGKGVIELVDGTLIEGDIYYNASNAGRVKITVSGEDEQTKYKVNEVARFTVGDIEYLNMTPSGVIGNGGIFVTLISNKEYDIKIYKYYIQNKDLVYSYYVDEITYYVQLPNEEKLIDINDMKLTPFHKKLPKYIADCTELCEKISKKEKGYKIGMLTTLDKKLEIYKKIAEEYNQSKI